MNPSATLGFGLGLRTTHYEAIFDIKPALDWFEIISENFMVSGGRPLANLMRIRNDYPMAMHGVSLSIGSTDALNDEYLRELKKLADRIEPVIISDHLCWTGVAGKNLHDLMPIPYTEEAVANVADRVRQVQDFLGRQILLENVSSYIAFAHSEMSEWEFLREIAERADCHILLDINNVFVNAFNHGFEAIEYLRGIPVDRVRQFHLAGHENRGDIIIDTHDSPVIDSVWELYAHACKRFGQVPTMIERDDNIPSLEELLIELNHAREIAGGVSSAEAMQ